MREPVTHAEIEGLLGVFALDALSPAEARTVERHLVHCPKCRAEVASHRQTAGFLGNVSDLAPEGLWDRIAGSLEEEPPRLDLDALTRRRRGQRNLWVRAVSVVAAAALIAIAVLSVELTSLNHRLNQLNASVPSSQLSQQVAGALANPQARRAELSSTAGGQTASAVVLPDGRGYLIATKLAPLPAEETYQLWGVAGSTKVSLGLLGARPSEVAFAVGSGTHFSLLAITTEQAGGVVVSNKSAVVWGPLSSA